MGYAIIDRTTKYKGSKRVAHVTPKTPSEFVNNSLTKVVFNYGNLIDNKFSVNSVLLLPATTTAQYRFELSAQRAGVSINSITGEVEISSGFDGGEITIIAKNANGAEVGRCTISNIVAVDTDVYTDLQILSFSYNKLAASTANSTASPTLTYSYKKNGVPCTITKSSQATDAVVEYSKTNDPNPSYAIVNSSTGVVKFTSANEGNETRSCSITVSISLPGILAETESTNAGQINYTAPVINPEINITTDEINISTQASTTNTYIIETKGAVGALSIQSQTGDTSKFVASLSDGMLSVTTLETNNSGADYRVTLRIGDGTYYQDVTVVQPYNTYYIDSISYEGTIIESPANSGIYIHKPTIIDNKGNTYQSLADYNAVPGAEHYDAQGTRKTAASQQASNKGIVFDETTGNIKFIKEELTGMLYVVTFNLVFQNIVQSSRKVSLTYENKTFTNTIMDFSNVPDEEWESMSSYTFATVSEDENITYDGCTLYKMSSNTNNAYISLIGNVTKGDIIYLDLETTSGDPWARLYVVESNTALNQNKTVYYEEDGTIKNHTISGTITAPRTKSTDFIIKTMGRTYFDGGTITENNVRKFKVAYIVNNTCDDAFIMIKWAVNSVTNPITNAIPEAKYYIQRVD